MTPNRPNIDISDAIPTKCSCGCEYFKPYVRLSVLSRMSPKNPTGQDILLKTEAYLCRDCEVEYGKKENK